MGRRTGNKSDFTIITYQYLLSTNGAAGWLRMGGAEGLVRAYLARIILEARGAGQPKAFSFRPEEHAFIRQVSRSRVPKNKSRDLVSLPKWSDRPYFVPLHRAA
jgi:hypothetical protein